jgi:hypothetical protein
LGLIKSHIVDRGGGEKLLGELDEIEGLAKRRVEVRERSGAERRVGGVQRRSCAAFAFNREERSNDNIVHLS